MSRSGLHTFARKYGIAPRTRTESRVGDWGDFASGALSAITSAAHAGIAESQRDDQEKADAATAATRLAASIAADASATQANAQARWSAQMRRPSAAADAATAAAQVAAQDAAGARLSTEQIPARVAAARKVFDDAEVRLRTMKGKHGEVFAKSMADAAQATYNKASGQQIVRQVPDDAGVPRAEQKISFWTEPLVGPVPGWGVVAGGAGVGVILWRLLRGKWGF